MLELPQEDKLVVTQSHALAKSIYDMTLLEKRIVQIAIAVIRRTDEELSEVRVSIPDFAKFFEIKGNSIHKRIEHALNDLSKRQIRIEEDGEIHNYNWVATTKYVPRHRSKGGTMAYFEVELNRSLSRFLLGLEGHFQSYALSRTKGIGSFDIVRFFEILHADSLGFKKRKLYYDLEDLKERLACDNLDYRDFRRDVLDRAVEELAVESGVIWSYTPEAKGRKVVGLWVQIKNSPAKVLEPLPEGDKDEKLISTIQLENDLREAGFKENARPYIEDLGVEQVRTILAYCKQEKRERIDGKAIRNLGAFIHHHLKRASEDKHKVIPVTAAKTASPEDLKRLAELLANLYAEERVKFTDTVWEELSQEERDTLREQLERKVTMFDRDTLNRESWAGTRFRTLRSRELLKRSPELFPPHLKDLEAFAEHQGLFVEYGETQRREILKIAQTLL
jgi:plasmid replication initiation protein